MNDELLRRLEALEAKLAHHEATRTELADEFGGSANHALRAHRAELARAERDWDDSQDLSVRTPFGSVEARGDTTLVMLGLGLGFAALGVGLAVAFANSPPWDADE